MKWKELVPWRSSESKNTVRGEENHLAAFQREMNSLLEKFFTGLPLSPFSILTDSSGSFSPRINVEETDSDIIVRAEVPGLEEGDVTLSLTDENLTIRGEKKQESEKTEGVNTYYEASYGSFERVIPLGVEIDQDRVDASLKKGVLTVQLPKTEREQKAAKKISVRTE